MRYTLIDLFCGAGALSNGFERTGAFGTVLGIDVCAPEMATFAANHPTASAACCDLRDLPPQQAADAATAGRGRIDAIVGGPPCQGFSSLRPFRSSGSEDPRNSLFEVFLAYVAWFRPKVCVMENVAGLVSHGRGAVIEAICERFAALGYNTRWRILDAADFGVPQRRKRLVLIAARDGAQISFPAPTHTTSPELDAPQQPPPSLKHPAAGQRAAALTVAEAISDLPALDAGERAERYGDEPANGYQAARRARSGHRLTWHEATAHRAKMLGIIRQSGRDISSVAGLVTSGFSSCYSRLAADEPSATLTVRFVNASSHRCIHPSQDRALTPREGARLQSFDDDYEFCGNKGEVARQIGNAVPPLLAQAIAEAALQILGCTQPQRATAA